MHTPGPYFPDLNGDNTIHTADGFIVATVNPYASSFDNGEHLANQRLLAAAPELLAALETLLDDYIYTLNRLDDTGEYGCCFDVTPQWEQAKAAIVKAKGETP